MRSLIPFRPRHHDCEWIGGRYTLPNKVRVDDVLVQPEVVLWLELPRGVIVYTKIIDSSEPVPFAKTLEEAMKHPGEGSPREPTRIRVPDAQLAEALKGVVGKDVPVVVAPVPELDAAFDDLISTLGRNEPHPTYLADGAISPAVVASLFSVASLLFRAAPWRQASEVQVLRVDIPALEVDGGCLSIIGSAGHSFGLLLFRSLEAYEAFTATLLTPATKEERLTPRPKRETTLLSLSFDPKKDLPTSMLREIERHRWPVAGAKAYPTVMAVDADARPRLATERDFRVMTACTTAFLAFFAHHREMFDVDEPEAVRESFTADDDVSVTLTAPYEAHSLFDGEGFSADDEDDLVVSAPPPRAVGRNEPCPCGSGKKYKKCHLDADRASTTVSSETEPVHQMDFRLVRAISRFARNRFGPAWLGPVGQDFVGDEASLQLFLPWAAWTAVVDGKRVADSFLEENGALSDEEHDWFAAQRRSWLSIWEVTRVEPGTIDVRDLLTGQQRSVREGLGSRTAVARDTLLIRVIDFRGLSLLGGFYGRVLPPTDALEVIRAVRSKLRTAKRAVAVERLQDPLIGRFMIDRWKEAVDELDRRRSIPPKLQNTDGDPLLFVTESFPFEGEVRSQIEKRIAAMDGVDDVDTEDGETVIVFVQPGNPVHRSWENTVVGRVIVAAGALRIETNSERRADTLRRRVRDACADLIGDGTRKTEDASAMLAAAPRNKKPKPMTAREQAALRDAKEVHFRDWVDTPIPALGGKTPRAAARAVKSRQKLDLLLREIENQENRLPEATRFDISRIRRELGLEP